MKPQVFTVHADPKNVETLVSRLVESAKDKTTDEPTNTTEAVLERLKRNLQYNSSPAIPYVKVGIEDAKIMLEILERSQTEEQA